MVSAGQVGCLTNGPVPNAMSVGGITGLELHHALGLGAFFPLHNFELHFLAFFQGLEPFTFDVAVVDEDIGTVGLGNEAVPF